ncbi:hypothetical protein WA158_005583 [Blastocystis sp. Blastoise]
MFLAKKTQIKEEIPRNKSNQVTIVDSCLQGQFNVTFRRVYGVDSEGELVTIYKGMAEENNVIDVLNGNLLSNQTVNTSYCMDPVIYTIAAEKIKYPDWNYKSKLIVLIDEIIIFENTLDKGFYDEWTILPLYTIPKSSIWKYTFQELYSTNWYTSTYDDSSWKQLSTSILPITTKITTYYRIKVQKPILKSSVSLFKVGIYSKEGVIVRINEHILFTRNMNNIYITPQSYATNIDDTYSYHIFTGSYNEYIQKYSSIIFCVEIHSSKDTVGLEKQFNAYFIPIVQDHSYRSTNGIISIEESKETIHSEYLFDNHRNTIFTCHYEYACITIYQFMDDQIEWINQYEIINGNNNNQYDLSSILLEGSNDYGHTWIQLDEKHHIQYHSNSESYTSMVLSHTISYNSYRFSMMANNNSHLIEIGDIRLFANSDPIYDNLTYSKSNYIFYKNIDKVYIYPLSSSFSSFTLSSSSSSSLLLPKGLQFDHDTGEIYGIPTDLFDNTIYISAKDNLGFIHSISIPILVQECIQNDYKLLYIYTISGSYTPWNENVELYTSNSLFIQSFPLYSSAYTSTLCLTNETYYFLLKSKYGHGWTSYSTFTVSLENKYLRYPILKEFLFDGYEEKLSFTISYLLEPKSYSTNCHLTNKVFNINWYKEYINEFFWISCYNPHSIPFDTDSPIQLFQSYFYINSLIGYHSIEVLFYASSSAFIYINGILQYIRNIDSIPITIDTLSTSDPEDIDFHYHRVTISIELLKQGKNLISLGHIYTNNRVPNALQSIYSVRLLSSSDYVSKTIYANGLVNPENTIISNPRLLLDGHKDTRWIYTSQSVSIPTIVFTISLQSDNCRSEYLNKYCFINNYDTPESDPSDWTVYGCSSLSCDLLDSVENVLWKSRVQQMCFYMKPHTDTYTNYKFIFLKNAGYGNYNSLALSEIQLLTVDINSIIIYPLEYTPSHIIGYKDVNFPTLIPNDYYHRFSILSGILPYGLSLNTATGYIYGIPFITTSSETILIQAYNIRGEIYNTSITVVIQNCMDPYTLFTVEYNSYGQSVTNTFGFSILHTKNNTLLGMYTDLPGFASIYYTFCVLPSQYSVILIDTSNYGWESAYIYIFIKGIGDIGRYSLGKNESPKKYDFEIDTYPSINNILWKYIDINMELIDLNWTSIQYNDISWSTSTIQNMTMPINIYQYYRSQLYLDVYHDYSALYFLIQFSGIIHIYLNGYEIQSIDTYNNLLYIMNNNNLNNINKLNHSNYNSLNNKLYDSTYKTINQVINTESIPLYYSPSMNIFSISVQLLNHTSSSSSFFSGYYKPIEIGRNHVIDGTYQSNNSGFGSTFISNIFDNNINTRWRSSSSCEGTTISWTYNNNKQESINSYTFISSNDCNNYHPSSWILEGSNQYDGIYTLLHVVWNETFSYYFEEKHYQFISSKPYNHFRFTILKCNNKLLDSHFICNNDFVQLAEIQLFIENTPSYCSTIDNWPAVPKNTYSYQLCPTYYSGYIRRYCNSSLLFESIDNSTCQLLPPQNIQLSTYILYAKVDTPIEPILPSFEGLYCFFYTYPSLPLGLSINKSNGTISGIPLKGQEEIQYTYYIENSSGSNTISFSIIIDGSTSKKYCLPISVWTITPIYTYCILSCPEYYTGIYRRYCDFDHKTLPFWREIENTCTPIYEPVSIHYNQFSYLYKINEFINIEPIFKGYAFSWSISPSLPSSITFYNGTITGTSSIILEKELYNVKVKGINNIDTFFMLEVTQYLCEADDIWPRTKVGDKVIILCPSDNYNGQLERICLYNEIPIWSSINNTCILKSPYLKYPNSYILLDYHIDTLLVEADCIGDCDFFNITPTLPLGLYINNTSGQLYGEPFIPSSEDNYTITVYTSYNTSTSVNIYIKIRDDHCPKDGIWPSVSKGTLVEHPCENINKEGNISRYCNRNDPPSWNEVINSCIYKTPIINYPNTFINAILNVEFNPLIPITKNYIETWSIVPNLPIGLILNNKTGVISGIPIVQSRYITHTLIAKNPDRSVYITLFSQVSIMICDTMNIWNNVSVNTYSYTFCEHSQNRIQRRYCSYNKNTNQSNWLNPEVYYCRKNEIEEDSINPFFNSLYIPIYINKISVDMIKLDYIYAIYSILNEYIISLGLSSYSLYYTGIGNNTILNNTSHSIPIHPLSTYSSLHSLYHSIKRLWNLNKIWNSILCIVSGILHKYTSLSILSNICKPINTTYKISPLLYNSTFIEKNSLTNIFSNSSSSNYSNSFSNSSSNYSNSFSNSFSNSSSPPLSSSSLSTYRDETSQYFIPLIFRYNLKYYDISTFQSDICNYINTEFIDRIHNEYNILLTNTIRCDIDHLWYSPLVSYHSIYFYILMISSIFVLLSIPTIICKLSKICKQKKKIRKQRVSSTKTFIKYFQ